MIDVLGRGRPLILNVLLNELAFSHGGASSEFVRFSTQLPTCDLCQSRGPLVGRRRVNVLSLGLITLSLCKCGSLGTKNVALV